MFAIGRFLRLSVANLRLRIPTEDLPSTRRLVALCQDIYVARAEGGCADGCSSGVVDVWVRAVCGKATRWWRCARTGMWRARTGEVIAYRTLVALLAHTGTHTYYPRAWRLSARRSAAVPLWYALSLAHRTCVHVSVC